MMFPTHGATVAESPESDSDRPKFDGRGRSMSRRARWLFVGYSVALIVGGFLVGGQVGFGPSDEVPAGASMFLVVGGMVIIGCLADRATLAPIGVAFAGGVLAAFSAYWGLDQPAPVLYGVAVAHVAGLFMAGDAARTLIRSFRSAS